MRSSSSSSSSSILLRFYSASVISSRSMSSFLLFISTKWLYVLYKFIFLVSLSSMAFSKRAESISVRSLFKSLMKMTLDSSSFFSSSASSASIIFLVSSQPNMLQEGSQGTRMKLLPALFVLNSPVAIPIVVVEGWAGDCLYESSQLVGYIEELSPLSPGP